MIVGFFHVGNTPHLKNAELLVASARIHNHGVRVIQVSDRNTERLPNLLKSQHLKLKDEWMSGHLMVDNITAQIEALKEYADYDEPMLFLDTDVLVNCRIEEAFPHDGNWHMGVTWRDDMGRFSEAMPYNYGVMYLRDPVYSMMFLNRLRGDVLEMERQCQDWYGNQLALRKRLGALPEDRSTLITDQYLVNKGTGAPAREPTVIKLFPCETHNYSPDMKAEDCSMKHFIHFKGQRKAWMQHHYNRMLETV